MRFTNFLKHSTRTRIRDKSQAGADGGGGSNILSSDYDDYSSHEEYLVGSKTVTLCSPTGEQVRCRGESLLRGMARQDGNNSSNTTTTTTTTGAKMMMIVETLMVLGDRLDLPKDEANLEPLLSFLRLSPTLKRLSLNTIRDTTLYYFLRAAMENPMIEEIRLQRIFLHNTTLISLLEHSKWLKHLSMTRLCFEPHTTDTTSTTATTNTSSHDLIHAFSTNTSLEQLDIALIQSPFRASVFRPIAQGIQQSSSLERLDLYECTFDSECTELFLHMMKSPQNHLKKLRLRCNVQFATTTTTSSSSSSSKSSQADVLADILSHKPPNLQELHLLYCGIQENVSTLLQPLQQQSSLSYSSSTSTLECLSIDFHRHEMQGLLECIPTLVGLKKLHLKFDRYTIVERAEYDALRNDLLQAIQQNLGLQEILIRGGGGGGCSYEEILERDRKTISLYCRRNVCLQEWRTCVHLIPEACSVKVFQTVLSLNCRTDIIFGLLKGFWAQREHEKENNINDEVSHKPKPSFLQRCHLKHYYHGCSDYHPKRRRHAAKRRNISI